MRLRILAQCVVRIGRDRVGDLFEQRDVVMRIAVEVAALEIAENRLVLNLRKLVTYFFANGLIQILE